MAGPKSSNFWRPNTATFTQPVSRATLRGRTGLAEFTAYPEDAGSRGTKSKRSGPSTSSDTRRIDDLEKWVRKAKEYWKPRNERFQRDQETYQLKKPDHMPGRDDDAIILSDPKILVKKVSRLIARHPPVIEVPPAPGVPDLNIAQRIENYLYAFDQSLNQKWMMGLNNPIRYDQAFYLTLRGWLAERTLFYPDGYEDMDTGDYAALWDHQLIDPATVYPYVAGNKIRRVVHSYGTTVGELKDDPYFGGKVPATIKDMDDEVSLVCNAVYWEDGSGDANKKPSWWHAITVTVAQLDANPSGIGEFLKKPVELGYNPWNIVTANGASYRATDWDFDGYVEQIGTGMLDESADTFTYINKMTTKLNELLSLEANPPAIEYSTTGEPRRLNLGPGGRNTRQERDKVELLRVGVQRADYQLLWEILNQRLGRAGMPAAFFAEYGGDSGFSSAILMAAGKDILFPLVEAINHADALRARKILELYRDFGPSKPLRTYDAPSSNGDVASAEITEADIEIQGTFIRVTREDMTPQELGTKIQLGLAILREKGISMERFRKEYIGLKNPAKENRDVLAEMVYMDENVIKQLIPLALSETGKEQLMKIWELVQNPMPPVDQMPQEAPVGQVDPATGLPLGGPPPQNTGQLAPEQMNDRYMPGQNPILQLLQAQALGGGGAGGTPPIPGTGNPVAQMPFIPR